MEFTTTKGTYEDRRVSQRGSLRRVTYRILRFGVKHGMISVGICQFWQTGMLLDQSVAFSLEYEFMRIIVSSICLKSYLGPYGSERVGFKIILEYSL